MLQRYLAGYVNIFNHRLLIFGFNAMHVAVNIKTPWGWLCFHPPLIKTYGRSWPWYLYHSRDGTPLDGWGFGPGYHGKRLA